MAKHQCQCLLDDLLHSGVTYCFADFPIQKVERNIAYLEEKPLQYVEDYSRRLALSEDCVESAHKSIQRITEGAHLGMLGCSWTCSSFFIRFRSCVLSSLLV